MALVNSTMLNLGTLAPDFSLPDPEGNEISLSDTKGENATMVVFMCNHCPYVIHIKEALNTYAIDYLAKGVKVVAINSNDMENYPADNVEAMKSDIKRYGYVFPYLIDEDQLVAKAYHAICTPDFYLFDAGLKLVYRGQFDATRPNNGTADGTDLRLATEALLELNALKPQQLPAVGCNIKWKPGNEPDYFG